MPPEDRLQRVRGEERRGETHREREREREDLGVDKLGIHTDGTLLCQARPRASIPLRLGLYSG
jgi:hypothetical protein